MSSLVNVNCINPRCGHEFKVTREAVNAVLAEGLGLGIEFPADIDIGGGVEARVEVKVAPSTGELCPRCAYVAARIALNNFERDIPDLMKGTHLSTNSGPVDNL